MAAEQKETFEPVVIGGRKNIAPSQLKMAQFSKSVSVDIEKFDTKKREGLIKYAKELHSKFSQAVKFKIPQPETLLKERFTPKEEKDLTCDVTVIRPKNPDGKLPGLVFIHGGGMCLGTGKEGAFIFRNYGTASKGFVVCNIHFTNSYVESFPRGLNDCANAIEWFHKNQEKFGLLEDVGVVVYGESGGANLSLASALKLKGKKVISGLHLHCPYTKDLHGDLEESTVRYPSLLINKTETFMKSGNSFHELYTPDPKDHKNPLAWPSYGKKEDFKGLPPTLIVVNEIDEIRDVGIELFRNLKDAEVQVGCTMSVGIVHAGDGNDKIMADVFNASMYRFARMCTGVEPSSVTW